MKSRRRAVTCALAAGLALAVLVTADPARRFSDGDGQASERGTDSAGLLRIDRSMLEVAAATGGDFCFWSPGEFAQADLRMPVVGDSILLSYGELERDVRRFSFAVDGLTGRLDMLVGAQRVEEIRILPPLGGALREADPGVGLQTFERMCIASVERPLPGEWRIEILGGRGAYCLSAHTSVGDGHGYPRLERVRLLGVAFVELRGRPGHQGYFPRKEPVVPGERQPIELTVSGSFETLELSLVGRDGAVVGDASVDLPEERDETRWVTVLGECVVPDVPFRFSARGEDATGGRYQRTTAACVSPRGVK